MKKNNAPAVKLKKTEKYNTYQFYAVMACKETDLTEGLKFAALSTYRWLRERLDNTNVPNELLMLDPSEYKKVKNEDFKSFYINDVFTITVETNIEEGLWALRIIENDLGALKESEIVPGRVIQSDIAYRVVDDKLECGFKTQVSDANNTEKASCIRYKLIKELGTNPLFGFKQINNLYDPNKMVLNDEDSIEQIKKVIKSKENQLPIIIYAFDDYSVDTDKITLPNFSPLKNSFDDLKAKLPPKEKEDFTTRALPYSNRYLGNARPYFLPKKLFTSLSTFLNFASLDCDQVIVADALRDGGKTYRYDYNDKDNYQSYINNYTRDKSLDFHDVLFVDEAKTIIERLDERRIQESFKLLDEAEIKIEQFKSQQAREIRKSEYKAEDNSSKQELIDALQGLQKSEEDKKVLNKEIDRLKKELKKKNDYIEYVHRKEQRPKYHKDIPNWASRFDSLIIDKKAVALLEDNSAENVDLNVICDALDYLGTAYSEYLFSNRTEEELNEISSNIYNRPFNVTPSGIPTSARGECKVKYAFVNENRIEHILDQHLKIGAHGELLRIYFIVDKERQKIVIGSLPNHLEY